MSEIFAKQTDSKYDMRYLLSQIKELELANVELTKELEELHEEFEEFKMEG